jgi:hypothetical protein
MTFNSCFRLNFLMKGEKSLQTTENIEKTMLLTHGYCFEEYNRSLDKKIVVEKNRAQEYQKSKAVTYEANKKMR